MTSTYITNGVHPTQSEKLAGLAYCGVIMAWTPAKIFSVTKNKISDQSYTERAECDQAQRWSRSTWMNILENFYTKFTYARQKIENLRSTQWYGIETNLHLRTEK